MRPRGPLDCSDGQVLYEWCLAGLGLAWRSTWEVQADIDAGARPGVSAEESAEIKRLNAENRRLTEDPEIMRRASIFFASVPE